MKTAFCRFAALTLGLLLYSASAHAQLAATNHKVILRRDPSTSSPILARLSQGARLVLVDATPDSGFYHVRTEDDQVGWIAIRFVTVSPQSPASPAAAVPASSCDASIAVHVYHPQRLIVKQDCISVSGTIVDATASEKQKEADGVRHEPDGDTHGWLKLDPGSENLLNSGNINDEGGNLVFEIICKFPVTQADAKAACQNYTDQVKLPPVGSHVRIVGRYVQDTFHGQWNEIHPVTSITATP
jgi:uncharacterized protein YgiM (DUF1202 family)